MGVGNTCDNNFTNGYMFYDFECSLRYSRMKNYSVITALSQVLSKGPHFSSAAAATVAASATATAAIAACFG